MGTHGDNSPTSGSLARGFADAINTYNARKGDHATLVNATLPQIADVVDQVETKRHFLPDLRGDYGISWDAWPVTLAKYAAAMRSGKRSLLGIEALLAEAAQNQPKLREETQRQHARAEWDLMMLADHAWNGNSDANRNVNSELRRKWGEELARLSSSLEQRAWQGAGLTHNANAVTLFNSLSFQRRDLVRAEITTPNSHVDGIASQTWRRMDTRYSISFHRAFAHFDS